MITDAILEFGIFLLRGVILVLPVHSLGLDWSPLGTMGQWMGGAFQAFDMPFFVQVVGVWLVGTTVITTAKSSIWLYKRVRGA